REFVSDLEKIQIANNRGRLVSLMEVASLYPTTGPVSLQRDQQMRLVSVLAQADRDKLEQANQAALKAIADLTPPQGSYTRLGGEFKAMREAFEQLGKALAFAIFLVFLILAAQFESFTQPFIIMTTVPLSMAGVYLVLFMTGVSMSIPAYVGVIMLAGIVVNNAILLVDYINVLRARGYGLVEAAVESSKTRLRPVLMTTLTTVLGMAPMALGLGSGSEFYRPLALAVIGGLGLSTLFTLVLSPVLYILIAQLKTYLSGLFNRA
ncbi:MAG TPA: efflux RND transporter permease subunit, partial [bacterium]|nr:efflux RND transporter permease subunit [bacterium]